MGSEMCIRDRQKTAEAVVNQDGTVVFPIENAAKYIVTSKDLWTAAAKTEEMSVQTSEQSQSTAWNLSGNCSGNGSANDDRGGTRSTGSSTGNNRK